MVAPAPLSSPSESLGVKLGSVAAAVGRLSKDLTAAVTKQEKENQEIWSVLRELVAKAEDLRKVREKWEPVIDKFMKGPGKIFLKG